MGWLETFRIAWRGVNANKTRSFLTVLGVLIGVASVVILVAVGNGSSIAVARQFQSLGTNTLTVSAGGFGPRRAGSSVNDLTMKDVDALSVDEHKKVIKAAVPSVNASAINAVFGDATTAPDRFTGTSAEMAEAGAWKLAQGRFLSTDEVDGRRRVAVLGATVATNLFGEDVEPVGQKVAFNHVEFEVIGVLKAKGTNGFQDQDNIVFTPWTTVRDTFVGGRALSQITVQAISAEKTTEAETAIVTTLDGLHPPRNGQSVFTVRNQASLLASRAESSKTLTVLLGAVAAISLLVGGIGIMNIMLVTVTERTREIGIRKAVGAPKGAILGQFLLESVVLGGIGGVVGVIAGIVGSRFKIVGTQPVVRYDSVILALFVSVAVSLFFGLYPANRAASMRPIDALRHE